jgi:hypothetical protein
VALGDAVLCQRIQDQAVLLNMDTQQYYGLNPTASEMWDRLVELHDIDAVEALLHDVFEAEPEVVKSDLRNLVGDLVGAGLLKAHHE